jgi:predicted nucleotidyltransferase
MPGVTDPMLTRIVPRLAEVPGIVAVVLGGSRARGTASATSDYDVGLYYGPDEPLDTEHLLNVVGDLVDDSSAAAVTPVGGWGPRIVGGGWLSIGGRKVDLLYRGVEPVRAVISDCRAGQISMDYQPGHPHGFCSAIWMGEVALCEPLHDPQGLISEGHVRQAGVNRSGV